jgi:undecaprenyl-diphosphatase
MLKAFDVSWFNVINHDLSNPVLNVIMPAISRLGGGELYFVLGVIFLFSKRKEVRMFGVFVLAGLTVSYYAANLIKVFVARPRPFVALTNVILLGPMAKSYSFPSAHATQAFMMAAMLAGRFKKYILFYSLAALVAFSRIYVGVHYPSDVLAGAVIGIVVGLFLAKMYKDLVGSQ